MILEIIFVKKKRWKPVNTSAREQQYIIACNSIVATAPRPHTYCNTFSVPPINTILLQYLLQYIAIQCIVYCLFPSTGQHTPSV